MGLNDGNGLEPRAEKRRELVRRRGLEEHLRELTKAMIQPCIRRRRRGGGAAAAWRGTVIAHRFRVMNNYSTRRVQIRDFGTLSEAAKNDVF